MKAMDSQNQYGCKEGWTKRVIVIGNLTDAEAEALHESSRQPYLVYVCIDVCLIRAVEGGRGRVMFVG